MNAVRTARTEAVEETDSQFEESAISETSMETPPAEQVLPLNLVLCTATVPAALHTYLTNAHPDLVRLVTPTIHTLPRTLTTERVSWSGGNRLADIHQKIREIFAGDATRARAAAGRKGAEDVRPSKVIIFCNKAERVGELGGYLEAKGVECVRMTGESDARRKGSNKHLEAFLNLQTTSPSSSKPIASSATPPPRILITTSLLSRGLDFSPDVKHILIADEPKNEVDFLHRAGRSGRAGRVGNVIVFGKGRKRSSRKWA